MFEERSRFSKVLLVSYGILIFLAFVSLIVLASVYFDDTESKDDFAIVFDAGSSSTKMYIYNWPSGLSAARGDKIKVNQYYTSQNCTNIGIDSLTSYQATILYFYPCLELARRTVPDDRKDRTFIALAATAGMRLLNVTNSTQASNVIGYIQRLFSESEFLYMSGDQVQVITGEMEGVYAWLTANYFLDKFDQNTVPSSTYGVLDLGGASSQITFIPSPKPSSQAGGLSTSNYFTSLRIYGVDYQAYSTSFLCWGVNEIQNIYLTNLIIQNNYSNQPINSSCFASGTLDNFSTSRIASKCVTTGLFNFSTPVDLAKLQQNSVYQIRGTSNPTACQAEVAALLPNTRCDYGNGQCSFNNFYLPSVGSTSFYGINNYYYKLHNTEILTNMSLSKNLAQYKNQTINLCSMDYSSLLELSNQSKPEKVSEAFLKTTCFFNFYLLGLFDRYNMTSLANYQFVDTVNGNTVVWAVGYLFNQLNRDTFLPYEKPESILPYSYFVPVIILTCVYAFLAFLAIFICLFLF